MEGFTTQHASVFLTKERILAQKSIEKKVLNHFFCKKKRKKELFSKTKRHVSKKQNCCWIRSFCKWCVFVLPTARRHGGLSGWSKDMVRFRQQQKHFGGGRLRSQLNINKVNTSCLMPQVTVDVFNI